MPGLLDILNSDGAQLGLQMLAAAGPNDRPMSFGQRTAGAVQQAQQNAIARQQREAQAREQAQREVMMSFQLEQLKRQAKQQDAQDAFRSSIPSPQFQAGQDAIAANGGFRGATAPLPKTDPNQDLLFGAMRAGLISPMDYITNQRRDNTPKYMNVAPGGTVFDERAGKPIYTAPKEDATPGDWKLYQLSGAAGRGFTFDQWDQARKRAGATNVTLSTEKGYGEKIAAGMADRDLSAIDAARSAPDQIASAQRIRSILSSQKPITGTGADTRLALSKALYTAGLTKGEDVVATENLQRELSQATLAAVKSSGLGAGSGFSNADRDFLEKAAAGTIAVNAETLAKTAELNERVGRRNIDVGNAALKRVKSAPGMGTLPFGSEIAQPAGNVVDFGSLK